MKAHHALADGVSFAETVANFFDIAPEVRPPAPATTRDEQDTTVTTSLGLLREGLGRLRERPSRVLESLASWGSRFLEILRGFFKVIAERGRPRREHDQPSIFDARRTSLNGSAGIEKTYLRTRVDLPDVKRAAKARGVSVTDFVVATLSGALRRLLVDRGEVLKKDLIAFVPINVRGEGDTADLGNQISGMLVALHTELDDPEERLLAISADAAKTVGEQRARRAKIFQDLPRVLGPTLVSLGGRVAAAFSLFDHIPMANLMISSVPGPPIPLWLSGRRVESAAPFGPLFASFLLNVTVLGFGDQLEFGLLGCADQMADLATLRDYVHEEATALIKSTPS
jgi:WS/DGAT/MGAT family acyltransferase